YSASGAISHANSPTNISFDGNYWVNGEPTSLITCEDGGCKIDLTLTYTGTGGGEVTLSHASAADVGYTAIFEMLNTLEYDGISDHFSDLAGGNAVVTSNQTWQLPTGIIVDLDLTETTSGAFGGWSGAGTGSGDKRTLTLSSTASEVTASFWSPAAALAFSGD